MLDVGFQELIIIFVVALLVFGPKKLPEIGRTLGKGIGELRRALEGVKATISAEEEQVRRGVLNVDKGQDKADTTLKEAAGGKPGIDAGSDSAPAQETADAGSPGTSTDDGDPSPADPGASSQATGSVNDEQRRDG